MVRKNSAKMIVHNPTCNPGLRRIKVFFRFYRNDKQSGRAGIKASIRIYYSLPYAVLVDSSSAVVMAGQ